tara:strand:- start:257 stop:403 length:147 start_codon:yes stop_codon:yes gene_type:complete
VVVPLLELQGMLVMEALEVVPLCREIDQMVELEMLVVFLLVRVMTGEM